MTSQEGPQYFPNASNAIIVNPTVLHIGGDAYFNSSERQGLKLLLNNVSTSAFHDAAERGDPPRCHPHTRKVVRAEIMEWIQAAPIAARRKFIIWLYGPAGSGKTAIAQSIAEECERRGLLAASFFFSRTAEGRNDASRLVATIAYQISRRVPQVEDHLFTAVEQDPTIFTRTLATQIRLLLINPLRSSPLSMKPILVILDGVDECGPEAQAQAELLNALGTAIGELQHIQLLFIIASRPEYEIREAFNGPMLSPVIQSLVLDDNYKPDDDIRVYFDSMFEEICHKHLRLGSRFPFPWPPKTDVDLLVSKASGQFIFAATVMKFIDSARHHPADRLSIIKGLSTIGNETPFALLDVLYHFILSSVTDIQNVLEILTLLMLAGNYTSQFPLNVKAVEELLCFEVRRALLDMHALVFVPPAMDNESVIRIHHASLYDFLTDRSRSHDYYIDANRGHATLSRRWLKLVASYRLSNSRLTIPVHAFNYHCERSPASVEIADDLSRLNLGALLVQEGIICSENLYLPEWNIFFERAQRQACGRSDIFPRLQNQFDAFVLHHLSKYPPALQACIPAIFALSTGRWRAVLNDIFDILLHGGNQSAAEFNEIRKLDLKLLDILHHPGLHIYINGSTALGDLFRNSSRAGKHYVDGRSYVTLAREIVCAICPQPEEEKDEIEFEVIRNETERYFEDGSDPTVRIALENMYLVWFADILDSASTDFTLTKFLCDRVLQYRDDVQPTPGRQNIAEASLKYIQRCGIPYTQHTHPPHANACVICDTQDWTSKDISPPPFSTLVQPTARYVVGQPRAPPEDTTESPKNRGLVCYAANQCDNEHCIARLETMKEYRDERHPGIW